MAIVSSQFHVLAVDDSIIDRKLIERLLKTTSSFQVTAVDSVSKALELLGLLNEETEEEEEFDSETSRQSTTTTSDFDESDCSDCDSESHSLPLPLPLPQRQHQVNLIITDYSMPGMTGYDLLRKIKGSKSLRNIPVVMMSSENIPSRISRCLEEGAEQFLLKPVRLSDVHNFIKPHLLCSSQNYTPI